MPLLPISSHDIGRGDWLAARALVVRFPHCCPDRAIRTIALRIDDGKDSHATATSSGSDETASDSTPPFTAPCAVPPDSRDLLESLIVPDWNFHVVSYWSSNAVVGASISAQKRRKSSTGVLSPRLSFVEALQPKSRRAFSFQDDCSAATGTGGFCQPGVTYDGPS